MTFDRDSFELHLKIERAKRGVPAGLELAIIKFDPKKHPRDLTGKFREVLGGLQIGDEVDVPGGSRVTRTKDGFQVSGGKAHPYGKDYPGGPFESKDAPDLTTDKPDEAAKEALLRSAASDEPGSVGGDRPTLGPAALRSDEEMRSAANAGSMGVDEKGEDVESPRGAESSKEDPPPAKTLADLEETAAAMNKQYIQALESGDEQQIASARDRAQKASDDLIAMKSTPEDVNPANQLNDNPGIGSTRRGGDSFDVKVEADDKGPARTKNPSQLSENDQIFYTDPEDREWMGVVNYDEKKGYTVDFASKDGQQISDVDLAELEWDSIEKIDAPETPRIDPVKGPMPGQEIAEEAPALVEKADTESALKAVEEMRKHFASIDADDPRGGRSATKYVQFLDEAADQLKSFEGGKVIDEVEANEMRDALFTIYSAGNQLTVLGDWDKIDEGRTLLNKLREEYGPTDKKIRDALDVPESLVWNPEVATETDDLGRPMRPTADFKPDEMALEDLARDEIESGDYETDEDGYLTSEEGFTELFDTIFETWTRQQQENNPNWEPSLEDEERLREQYRDMMLA